MADYKIQVRRDTGSNWDSNNPVLAEGEVGLDTTVDRTKIGDGTVSWTGLTYSDDLEISYAKSGNTGGNNTLYPFLHLYTDTTLAGADQSGSWMTTGLGFFLKSADSDPYNGYMKGLYFGNSPSYNTPTGPGSVNFGGGNQISSGTYTFAMGAENNVSGSHTCAIGNYNTASGNQSLAFGERCISSGGRSIAQGYYCTAQGYSQTVVGQYNILTGSTSQTDLNTAKLIVGTGTGSTDRYNSLEVYREEVKVKSDLNVTGVVKIVDVVTSTEYGLVMSGGTLTTYEL